MDEAAKIALCKMCTLAEVMKDCKNCAFAIGLKHKESNQTVITASPEIKVDEAQYTQGD